MQHAVLILVTCRIRFRRIPRGLGRRVTQRLADLNRRLQRVTRKAKQSSDFGLVWRIQEATEMCRSGVRGESGPTGADPADRNTPTTESGQNQ